MTKNLKILLLILVFAVAVSAQNSIDKKSSELLEADKAFAKMSVEKGHAAAFDFYMAEDIIFVPMGEKLMTDRKAILEYFSDGVASVDWKPMRAEVSKSKDLGYTYGVSEMKFKSADGKISTRYYNYISVWRKNKKGEWKMIVDMGNSHPAPSTEKPVEK